MTSLKRAPEYSLIGNFKANRALAAVKAGDVINCNGYEYLHLQVIAKDGAQPTLDVAYWFDGDDEDSASPVPADPAIQHTAVLNGAFEITVPVRGRKVALGVDVGAAGSVKVLASGFNWVQAG
jgi:hypothetical protein